MKRTITLLVCTLLLKSILFSQCIQPDSLFCKRTKYYKDGIILPYSGCVEGFANNRNNNLGGMMIIACEITQYHFNTQDTTNKSALYPQYLLGNLKGGKEVGEWNIYTNQGILLGTCFFHEETNLVDVVVIINDRIIANGIIPYSEINCKSWKRTKLNYHY